MSSEAMVHGGNFVCGGGHVYVWLWTVAADTELVAEGMVALTPALGKLVALTSLDLSSTWLGMRRMGGVLSNCGAGLCGRRWSTVVMSWRWWSWVCVAVNDGCREQVWR